MTEREGDMMNSSQPQREYLHICIYKWIERRGGSVSRSLKQTKENFFLLALLIPIL